MTLGLAGCGFSITAPGIEPDASDGPPSDAPPDAAVCTTDPGGPCPPNYLFVAQNCAYDAGEFCIAKYEMKNGGGGVAQSAAAGAPWGYITTENARLACAQNGPRYHLVTNDEWMATARAIEATPVNWSTTATPFLSKGKTDDCGGGCPGPSYCPAPASTDNDPCFTTIGPGCANRNSADFRFNRTHRIGTTGVIWDFAGNMFELIDHPATTNATEGAHPGAGINATTGASFSPPLADSDYKSANLADTDVNPVPRVIPDQPVQGVGILYVTSTTSSRFTRGGDFCSFAGIYSVSLLRESELLVNVGFRCAYK